MTDAEKLRYYEWLIHGEVGASSATMWEVLSGLDAGRVISTGSAPVDADDFSRCYKLIKQFPEWRSRLGEVAALSAEWKRVIDNWDEMSALYEGFLGDASLDRPNGQKIYALINGRPWNGPTITFEVRKRNRPRRPAREP